MRGKAGQFGLACAVAAGVMMASSAQAQTAPVDGDRLDLLLARLRDKGILTEAEYEQLAMRSRATANGASESVQTPVAAQADSASLQDSRNVQLLPAVGLLAKSDRPAIRAAAKGLGIEIGDVALNLSGEINGFYVHDSPDRNGPTIVGGLASTGRNSAAIRSGLLPSYFVLDVTTKQRGWDVGAHVGLFPGLSSITDGTNSPGNPSAIATSGIDVRKLYLTIGRDGLGELKIGRDIGLLASDAILNDMALFSVGQPTSNAAPSNAALGRIGVGMLYADNQPQITYTTPRWKGLQLSAGIFTPLTTSGDKEVNDTPGYQAKVTYEWSSADFKLHAWASGLIQKHKSATGLPDYTGQAFDIGARVDYGAASVVGYYYAGDGIGTTGLFLYSIDQFGKKRGSNGFYAQGTYKIDRWLLGVSYGESNLDLAPDEINPSLLRTNASWIGQVRYGLTDWASLVTEYMRLRTSSHGVGDVRSSAVAAGAIIFFP